jgi:hypothetical protein
MNTKHTEGPHVAKYNFASNRHAPDMEIRDQGGYLLAIIPRKGRKYADARPQAEQEANAALFAVAHDLLNIAQAYRNLLKTAAHTEGEAATYAHIGEVIAKATGQNI